MIRRALWMCTLAGCSGGFPDYSNVNVLSVMAIVAEPPEVPSTGARTTLTVTAYDPADRSIRTDWSLCTLKPNAAQTFNPDCVTDNGDHLLMLGSGQQIIATLPTLDPSGLVPDGTDGVYATIRADVAAGSDRIIAIYRLRIHLFGRPNQNPFLTDILFDCPAGTGGCEMLQDDRAVHAGESHVLNSLFSFDSAEEYVVFDIGQQKPVAVTEALSVAWFATAGTFSDHTTDSSTPTTTWTLDANQPPGQVFMWGVGRDERGGTSVLQKTLMVQ